MANTRVEITAKDIRYQQYAQSGRTMFTPGKAVSSANDENWPKDYKIPRGTGVFDESSLGSADNTFVRVVKTGRNIICDNTIVGTDDPDNIDKDNIVDNERQSGYNWTNKS